MAIKTTVRLEGLGQEVQGIGRVYRSHTIEIDSDQETAAIFLSVKEYEGAEVARQNLVEFDSNDAGDMDLWNMIWDAYEAKFKEVTR